MPEHQRFSAHFWLFRKRPLHTALVRKTGYAGTGSQ